MIKQSLQKTEETSDVQQDLCQTSHVQQHSCPDDPSVSIEEDEEKVIIHLDLETNQPVATDSDVQLHPVEVERKFKVTADTKIKLVEFGAELHKEKTFLDRYYDNPDYSLTLKDCWLRQRNGAWELKVVSGKLIELASQYQEITKSDEIVDFLVNHFHRAELSKIPIDQVVQKLNLTPFVEFTTTRQTYFLPECTIDLDLTDFGYQVGEIEVMASDTSQIPRALNTISLMAEKLGNIYIISFLFKGYVLVDHENEKL
jgi:thiamine-triphosphatase